MALTLELSAACAPCPLFALQLEREALAYELAETTLLVQSTSATLASASDSVGFANSLVLEALPPRASVVDLVYRPRVTSVLARAQELGLNTVDGLGMLLHQGALAFELWTHMAAPLEVMRAALEAP
jgi:shikimate dehydrogenase